MNTNVIPKTETPQEVYVWLFAIIAIAFIILGLFLGYYGLAILSLFMAFSTSKYTENGIPAFHGLILVNSITGTMRGIFPGLNPKLWWEHPQKNTNGEKAYIDTRTELSEVLNETYVAKDALMKTRYVYTIRPDLSYRFDTTPGEKLIVWSSYEHSAIKSKGRALFSMSFLVRLTFLQ